jgi:hypothetical protein
MKRRREQERDEATAREQADARREALLAELKAHQVGREPEPPPAEPDPAPDADEPAASAEAEEAAAEEEPAGEKP